MNAAAIRRTALRVFGRLPPQIKLVLLRSREAHFLVGVLAIVMDEENRVLLFRHTYRPFAPWGLPSGVLKPDESLEDSMRREVMEESGLAIEFQEMLRTRASSRPRRVDVWMRYRSLGGKPAPRSAEIDDARFFPLDQLPDLIAEQRAFLDDLPRLARGQG